MCSLYVGGNISQASIYPSVCLNFPFQLYSPPPQLLILLRQMKSDDLSSSKQCLDLTADGGRTLHVGRWIFGWPAYHHLVLDIKTHNSSDSEISDPYLGYLWGGCSPWKTFISKELLMLAWSSRFTTHSATQWQTSTWCPRGPWSPPCQKDRLLWSSQWIPGWEVSSLSRSR